MTTHIRFTQEQAPCGRAVGGELVRDDDGQGFLFEHLTWHCGCQITRRQYHDGAIHHRTVDHHGKVRVDEHSALHEG